MPNFSKLYRGGGTKSDAFSLGVGAKVLSQGVMQDEILTGKIKTTSTYELSGDYVLKSEGADLLLSLDDNYEASNALPVLYIYLSNNSASIEDALEIGAVTVFKGAHSYTIPNTGINDYAYILYFCKPFNVKVGEGVILP